MLTSVQPRPEKKPTKKPKPKVKPRKPKPPAAEWLNRVGKLHQWFHRQPAYVRREFLPEYVVLDAIAAGEIEERLDDGHQVVILTPLGAERANLELLSAKHRTHDEEQFEPIWCGPDTEEKDHDWMVTRPQDEYGPAIKVYRESELTNPNFVDTSGGREDRDGFTGWRSYDPPEPLVTGLDKPSADEHDPTPLDWQGELLPDENAAIELTPLALPLDHEDDPENSPRRTPPSTKRRKGSPPPEVALVSDGKPWWNLPPEPMPCGGKAVAANPFAPGECPYCRHTTDAHWFYCLRCDRHNIDAPAGVIPPSGAPRPRRKRRLELKPRKRRSPLLAKP
jgi:hypothetical protein